MFADIHDDIVTIEIFEVIIEAKFINSTLELVSFFDRWQLFNNTYIYYLDTLYPLKFQYIQLIKRLFIH